MKTGVRVLGGFALMSALSVALVGWGDSPVSLAGEVEVIRLWKETAPPGPPALVEGAERDLQKPEDRLVGGRTVMKLGHVANPEIHLYPAPPDKANGAACVVCPGGGFNILAWDLEGIEVAEWLNSIGVTAIVLKYRVPTRGHPGEQRVVGPAIDAQRALSLARHHAEDWKLDPKRIGVLGFSAGGETAALTALRQGRRLYEPRDVIDQAPCGADFAILVYPANLLTPNGILKANYVPDAATPPMFLVHTADDPVPCQGSIQLFLGLRRANRPAELHVYPSGGHGYGLRAEGGPRVASWPRDAAAWLGELKMLDTPATQP